MAAAASARFSEAGSLGCENLRRDAQHTRVASRILVTQLVPAIWPSFVQVPATSGSSATVDRVSNKRNPEGATGPRQHQNGSILQN